MNEWDLKIRTKLFAFIVPAILAVRGMLCGWLATTLKYPTASAAAPLWRDEKTMGLLLICTEITA